MTAVLIVEDDEGIRDDLRDILADEGYGVAAVSNGREALDYLQSNRPCVVLLDLMMPVMSGAEFREAQLRSPSIAEIPVVLLSGASSAGDTAQRLGINQFLRKPFALKDLLSTVTAICPPEHHRQP